MQQKRQEDGGKERPPAAKRPLIGRKYEVGVFLARIFRK